MGAPAPTIRCIACGAEERYPLWCRKGPELHEEHAKVHRCRTCAAKRGAVGKARPTGG